MTNPSPGGPTLTQTEIDRSAVTDLWEWLAMRVDVINRRNRAIGSFRPSHGKSR